MTPIAGDMPIADVPRQARVTVSVHPSAHVEAAAAAALSVRFRGLFLPPVARAWPSRSQAPSLG